MNKNTKFKLRQSLICLALGIVFIGGATLTFVNSEIGHSYIVRNNAEKVSKTLTAEQVKKNEKVKTSYDAAKTKPVSAKNLYNDSKYPAYPIGRMSIPAVNIHNPIFKGFGDHMQNLSYGVSTAVADREMGEVNNYVLAGHYMSGYGPAILDNLHLTKTGDMVYVTNMKTIYAYSIEDIELALDPHQVSVEDNVPGERTITLITCSDFNTAKYGYGGHRTVVSGTLTAAYKATKSNLIKYELADRNVSNNQAQSKNKSVKSRVKTTALQKLTLKQLIIIFATLWLLAMGILFTIIWIR